MSGRILILALDFQFNGNWDKIYKAVVKKTYPRKKYIAKAEKVQRNYLTLLDEDYPHHLKVQYRPPFVIAGTYVPPEERDKL